MAPTARRPRAGAGADEPDAADGESVLRGTDRAPRARAGRWWYANCAWDAFGICAALHADGRIETSCADCGEALAVEVANAQPDDGTHLFHCLVPAARWWDDIVFT